MLPTYGYDALKKKASQKLIPLSCLFELTYKCNLNCTHCYIVKDSKKEITQEQAFKIIDQLEKAGCLFLTFSGGEIFTRKDFFEIANYARDKAFALRLFTNGTLINSEAADRISELCPIAVEISLYGFKDTHEKIARIENSFEKTIAGIKLLKKRGAKVLVKTILMKENVNEFWKLRRFVEDLGVRMRGIGGGLLITPANDGSKEPLNYRLNNTQLEDYIQEEFRQMKALGKKLILRRVKQNDFLCDSGRTTVNITPYGEVNPCVEIRLKNNSIMDRPFIEIWRKNKDFVNLRKLHLSDNVKCQSCKLIAWCLSCPGVALSEEGSLIKPLKEACRITRIRKEIYNQSSICR